MSLPKVNITQTNGNLGILPRSEDGLAAIVVSGVAIGGQFALGDVKGPYTSLEEIEAIGINAAYDVTNTCLAHKQISDFYSIAPAGTKLYVMVVAKTVLMSTIVDVASVYVQKIFDTATGGKPKIVIITRVPDGAYAPTYTGQIEDDIHLAITKAMAMRTALAAQHVYTRFILEGRNWQGNVTTSNDFRDAATAVAGNRVSLAIFNDYTYAATFGDVRNKYASAGLAGGALAALPVQRGLHRVKNGRTPIVIAGYSNGAMWNTVTKAQQDTLHDKGYIFLRTFERRAGFYFSGDYTLAVETDDYGNLRYGRVIDKASEIAYETLVEELGDEVPVDTASGLLDPAYIKSIEGMVETNTKERMSGEITAIKCIVPANQNVISSPIINATIQVTPFGSSDIFDVKIGLYNPYQQS